MTRSAGFTLFEILIVMGLLVVILVGVAWWGADFYQQQVLDEEAVTLQNNLRRAQSQALAGRHDSSFGIKFFETHYVLFQGESYDGRQSIKDEIFSPLPSGLTISGASEIVFEKNTGYPIFRE